MMMTRLLILLALLPGFTAAGTQVDADVALKMLEDQNRHFAKRVVRVTDNVFTAVGFHGANTSMIVGNDGVIIVDTLMGPTSAQSALTAFRQYSNKPVKAIIYTHSHGDHTGGASAFVGDDNPDIYAMVNFGNASGVDPALGPIMKKRGIRQFGRTLPPEEATNRGLAPAKTADHDRGKGHLLPTVSVAEKHSATIAGIDIEIYAAPGETEDALFVWLPRERVLFAGDNFYHAFPNLYAIRGTGYRNVLNWAKSVAKMAAFEPDHLVGGHTSPISGRTPATTALLDYSNAIQGVYEQTIKGINQGKSPEQIAHEVALSADVSGKPYLIEFYGTVPHAVRAIYAGLLGWFDGNPTTLNRLHPRAEAKKVAQLAGGTKKLIRKMNSAMRTGDYQWALELADHLKWLEDSDRELARETKIAALRALAAREYNAPNRNYYLTYANELESGNLSEVWF